LDSQADKGRLVRGITEAAGMEINKRARRKPSKRPETQAARQSGSEAQKSAAFFAEALAVSPQPFAAARPDGGIVAVNDAFCYLTGYTRKELKKLRWNKELSSPESRKGEQEWLEELLRTGRAQRYEKELPRKDEKRRPVEVFASLSRDPKGKAIYYLFVNDISERKTAERALQESEEKYRALVNYACEAILLADFQGNFVAANKKAEELLGYSEKELLHMNVTQIHPRQEIARAVADFKKIAMNGYYEVSGILVLRKDGRVFPIDITGSVVSYAGKKILQGIFRDVSQRQKLEDELRQSEAAVKSLFNAPICTSGIFSVDGKILSLNDPGAKRFGKKPEELIGASLWDHLPPKFAARRKEQFAQVARSGKPMQFEDVGFDGLQIEFSLYPIFNPAGEVERIAVFMWDIAERKKAEQALEESESRLRLLTDNMTDLIGQTDVRGVILYASPSHKAIVGYAPEELMGKNLPDFAHPEDRERALRVVQGAFKSRSPASLEFRFRHKDGRYVWLEAAGRFLFNEKGVAETGIYSARDISQRKAAEQALKESEGKFKNLVQNAAAGVFQTDREGNLILVNPSILETLGYKEEEVLGHKFWEFIHMDDVSAVISRHMDDMKTGKQDPIKPVREYRVRRKDGGICYFIGRPVFLLKDGEITGGEMVGIDITEKKIIEKKLAEEKEELAVTLRAIGDGVIATDIDGKILLVNKAAEELTGFSQEQSLGRHINEVFKVLEEKTRMRCEDPVKKAIEAGETITFADCRILVSRQGRELILTDSAAPIRDDKGKSIGVVLIFRDITEQRRMQQEMEKAEKLESLGILAGGIAYDFNNILMAIIGNISFVRAKGQFSGEIFESLADAEEAVFRARDLVQQLLTFSRGGAPLKRIADLRGLIKDSATFVLSGSKAKCRFSIANDLWPAEVDQAQISQVINNTVINADQAMPEGGVIEISARNIVMPSEDNPSLPLKPGRYVIISIKDSGEGIPPENIAKLFDPFFTTKQRGTGLGLSICYSIITRHNGFIDVESKPGAGTAFSIYLPASESVPEARARTEQPSLLAGRGRILLMDDDEAVLSAASQMIRLIGFDLQLARHGAEAIDLYQKAKQDNNPFAAVIMDLTVPGGMGGKETIARLLEFDPQVRAVVSSGYSTDAVISDYEKYGFKAAITKPYNLQNLKEVLSKVISEKG